MLLFPVLFVKKRKAQNELCDVGIIYYSLQFFEAGKSIILWYFLCDCHRRNVQQPTIVLSVISSTAK